MKESLLVNQETAIEAINTQIAILKEESERILKSFFEKRKIYNNNKQAKRHSVQPRVVDTQGSFSIQWAKYIPPRKGQAQQALKTTHINKGKTSKYRYAAGHLKRACVSELEYSHVWETEERFESIRKSLFYLVESRKSLVFHQKNIELL